MSYGLELFRPDGQRDFALTGLYPRYHSSASFTVPVNGNGFVYSTRVYNYRINVSEITVPDEWWIIEVPYYVTAPGGAFRYVQLFNFSIGVGYIDVTTSCFPTATIFKYILFKLK